MNDDATKLEPVCVGIRPWLPWPLSAWAWWTAPVRAERLALLRIGLALCLLADIVINYAPETLNYFGKGGIGDPAILEWRFRTDRMTWSLLRGVADSTNLYLCLTIWLAASVWIGANSLASLLLPRNLPPRDRTSISLWLWSVALVGYVAGLWSQMLAAKQAHDAKIDEVAWTMDTIGFAWTFNEKPIDFLAWVVPLIGVSLACFFHSAELVRRLRDPEHLVPWFGLTATWVTAGMLTLAGFALTQLHRVDPSAWWIRALRSWQEDEALLLFAMGLWIGSTSFLLLGCGTRLAAIATWVLSMSFANANPNLDNAGDTIRAIVLFYLMMCPCGAVWSVDAFLRRLVRRQPQSGPVFVHPWPIRLLFVQMIFIYFMNGLYKLMGPNWLDGTSLHYVLGDVVLTRFSPFMLEIPSWLSRGMTWSVLAWEVSFPLLVLWKWSRRAALIMGVLFHLGIFATMELGGFVPYALCMYLPMLPLWNGDADCSNDPRTQ